MSEIDDDTLWDEEEEVEHWDECGRPYINGRLSPQCLLAGTEFCDWDCPRNTKAKRGPSANSKDK